MAHKKNEEHLLASLLPNPVRLAGFQGDKDDVRVTEKSPRVLSPTEIRDAAVTLRRVLDAVDRGDMDAGALMLAQIHGAVAALETLATQADDYE